MDTHDSLNRLLTKSAEAHSHLRDAEGAGPGDDQRDARTGGCGERVLYGRAVVAGTTTVTIKAVDASDNAAEAVYEVDQAGTGKMFTYV